MYAYTQGHKLFFPTPHTLHTSKIVKQSLFWTIRHQRLLPKTVDFDAEITFTGALKGPNQGSMPLWPSYSQSSLVWRQDGLYLLPPVNELYKRSVGWHIAHRPTFSGIKSQCQRQPDTYGNPSESCTRRWQWDSLKKKPNVSMNTRKHVLFLVMRQFSQ